MRISPRISKRREVGSVSSDLPPSMIRNTALLRHSFPTSPNPSLRRKVRGTFVHSFLVNFNKKAQSLREAYHILYTCVIMCVCVWIFILEDFEAQIQSQNLSVWPLRLEACRPPRDNKLPSPTGQVNKSGMARSSCK